MGQVTKNILGCPTGRIGDLIYRQRNGKVYVYPYKPREKRTPKVEESRRQKNFAFLAKLASALNKSDTLRYIWDSADIPGSCSYLRIQRYNKLHGCTMDNFNRAGIIPYPPGLQAELLRLSFAGCELLLDIRITGGMDNLSTIHTPEIIAAGFMMLQEPLQDEMAPYKVIPLSSGSTKYTGSEMIHLSIPIVGENLNLLGNYGVKQFVLVLITAEIYSGKKYYSNNISGEMMP